MAKIVYTTPGIENSQPVVHTLFISDALHKYLMGTEVPPVIRYLIEDVILEGEHRGKTPEQIGAMLRLKADGTLGSNFFSITPAPVGQEPSITMVPDNRVHPTLSVNWMSKQRQPMKPVRWLRNLFNDATLNERLIGDPQMEAFVNALKAKNQEAVDNNAITLSEVSGADITYWYERAKQVPNKGSLASSCMAWSGTREHMTGCQAPQSFKCYEACPGVRLLIAVTADGKLAGRVVLWSSDEFYYRNGALEKELVAERQRLHREAYPPYNGYSRYDYTPDKRTTKERQAAIDAYNAFDKDYQSRGYEKLSGTYMSGMYVATEEIKAKFLAWAKEHGYWHRDNYYAGIEGPDGRSGSLVFRVLSGRVENNINAAPYFDSVTYDANDRHHYYWGYRETFMRIDKAYQAAQAKNETPNAEVKVEEAKELVPDALVAVG